MNCKQVHELMGPYLYGDLSPDEMMEVRVHTQSCTECKEDLRTRGFAVSSLDDSVPFLSEEEKQRIAWSVKGAIKEKEKAPSPFKFRLAPAFALVMVLLLVGFVIGSRLNTPTGGQSPGNPADNNKPRVTVTISENKPEDAQLSNEKDNSQKSSTRHHRSFKPFRIPYAFTTPRLTNRNHTNDNRQHLHQEDSPMPVDGSASEKEKKESVKQQKEQATENKTADNKGVEDGEAKLPQPTDVNDAQIDTPTTNE